MNYARRLVAVLPGQGFREWFYDAEAKKAGSVPLLGWAVYSEYGTPDPDAEDVCLDYEVAIVKPLSVDGDGYVDEVEQNGIIGILPEGRSFTDDEAREAYTQKKAEEAYEGVYSRKQKAEADKQRGGV